MRTHYCGKIDKNIVASEVFLCGWVNRIRHHSGLIFINLRDKTGIIQVIIENKNLELFEQATKIHNEYVISISGIVCNRPKNLINHDMLTGEIEIIANKLNILSKSEPLPFGIEEYQDINDELRLKYRYLDLRRKEMHDKIIFRSKLISEIRNYFELHDFIEIETPILTKSTPEGARDFLVPSRYFHGQFYALPQSPQIFKQLLMVAGFDRYYQIARCFRDEDLRADRQPEFTQLDMEMSFVDENIIMTIIENLMRTIFFKLLNIELPNKFKRMTFQEALDKFGTDKPDLRIPLEFINVKDIVIDSNFPLFSEAKTSLHRVIALKLQNVNVSRNLFSEYEKYVKSYGLKGLIIFKVNDRNLGYKGISSSILKFLNQDIVENILERTKAKNGDIIFFGAGLSDIVNSAMSALRIRIGNDFNLVNDQFYPLWITDFPMFTRTEHNSFTFMHNPFTAPVNNSIDEILANPALVKAKAYDLVLNGFELGGGSIRINNYEMQKTIFNIIGLNDEVIKEQFGCLIDAFKYGYPPEGGIALGIDRMVMIMIKAKSIRDVIAFPKTQAGICQLMQAPAKVELTQLNDLNISVK